MYLLDFSKVKQERHSQVRFTLWHFFTDNVLQPKPRRRNLRQFEQDVTYADSISGECSTHWLIKTTFPSKGLLRFIEVGCSYHFLTSWQLWHSMSIKSLKEMPPLHEFLEINAVKWYNHLHAQNTLLISSENNLACFSTQAWYLLPVNPACISKLKG